MPLDPNVVPIIGSGINAAASIGGSLINAYSVKQQNKRNMENWREQTEYNTPKNQRRRMEEAGFNPALMMGGGAGSSGNAGPAPASERSPDVDLSAIGNVIGTFLEYKKKDAEIENIRVGTKRDRIGAEGEIVDNILKEIELKHADEKTEAEKKDAQNKEILSGYDSGRYGKDYIGNGDDIPYWQRHKADMDIKKNTKEIGDIRKDEMDIDLQRSVWEFKNDKERLQKIGVLPSDNSSIQTVKIIYNLMTGKILDYDTLKNILR